MKAWLQAEEPSVEILEFEQSPYVILKSGKDVPQGEAGIAEDSKSQASQLCRSIVWNTATNRPCSVAPFAARRDQKIPMGEALRIEDFVEGVMINIFRAKGDSETRVTTRSRLDADGTFYSERTFRELFEEAMEARRMLGFEGRFPTASARAPRTSALMRTWGVVASRWVVRVA
jgi:hypothetical protein